jgi:hypothetical protein
VIRDSFAAEIVISAQHSSRHFLWTVVIHAVMKWNTCILGQK